MIDSKAEDQVVERHSRGCITVLSKLHFFHISCTVCCFILGVLIANLVIRSEEKKSYTCNSRIIYCGPQLCLCLNILKHMMET